MQVKAIAEEMECCTSTVENVLKEAGLYMRHRKKDPSKD